MSSRLLPSRQTDWFTVSPLWTAYLHSPQSTTRVATSLTRPTPSQTETGPRRVRRKGCSPFPGDLLVCVDTPGLE